MSQVSVRDVLFDFAAPTEVSPKNRIIGFIALQRLGRIAIVFFPLVIATAALAGARLDDSRFPIGIIMVWLLAASDLVINSVVDAERDKRKWPLSPLASTDLKIRGSTLFYYTGWNIVRDSTCSVQLAQYSNSAFDFNTWIYLCAVYA